MTTDPFIDAARAEAERRWTRLPKQSGNTLRLGQCFGFVVGAEWARTHLATQEPTDGELDALYDAFMAHSRTGLSEDRESTETVCYECGYATNWPFGYRTEKRGSRHAAREAILAARAARRDEGHGHAWRWKQNTTSRGFPMPPIEVCPCGAARDARRDEEKR